jgi:hypoxanthine phosphoribosyltransferase
MRTLDLARRAVEAVGASEVRCATLAVHSFSEKPEWYALETDALIFFPWDKQVYAGNEWRLNPELAAELP